jgi:hypothetical protein
VTTIGGFLGLEPTRSSSGPYHLAPALSTGRSCLRFIVETVRPRRVHVPFYVCDAVIEPLRAAAVECCFYPLDESLAPACLPDRVARGELFLAVNYFGLMGRLVAGIGAGCRDRVVVDDSQGFFRQGTDGGWSFNSARKFFGVPDGAYLYGPGTSELRALPPATPTVAHLFLRLAGAGRRAYREFQRHEASLDGALLAMSRFTSRVMDEIDYARVAQLRRSNYRVLEELLRERNRLSLPLADGEVPLYYPFLAPTAVRQALVRCGVFVPCLWAEVATRCGRGFAWERELAARLCPLPVDQRHDAEAMRVVAARLLEVLDT